ncbi:Solute carrier family 35 member E3 [Fusarium oxysporum f. sp. raphani]|nr:Solute carrier family 35 member E3 [Fusarium oxysporum f. sp. raphani]
MPQEVGNKASVDSESSTLASPRVAEETVVKYDDLEPADRQFTRSSSEFELGQLYYDAEGEALLPEEHEKPSPEPIKKKSPVKAIIWTVVNVVATVLIVFTNKAIFSDKALKFMQLTFAAFHFTITWLALFVLSCERFAFFTPQGASFRQTAPLSIAMALNVVFPNLSLAYSTVAFYQIARILVTPVVAAMDYVLYKVTLPVRARIALLPACIGVGMVSYYDSRPTNSAINSTSDLGAIYAFAGVFFSSLYTVWIASYRRRLNMTSMQLLFNQAPISAFMLLYFIPFVDTFPAWTEVSMNRWVFIALSSIFAVLINVSQFFIVAEMGPVTSTVVAHSKTCIIVAFDWLSSGRAVRDKCVIGLVMACLGITA